MTKKELLDLTFAVHVLAAMLLINANGDLLAFLYNLDADDMSYRGPGFLGIAIIASALIICYGGVAFYGIKELPLLCLLFIGALILQTQIMNVIYFVGAAVSCLVWFFYKRNPPLF